MTRKRWAIAAILLLYPVVYFVAVRLDRQGAVDFKAIDSVAYATQQAVKEAERAREATSQAREEARQSDRATQRAYT
ncbi:MAG: hypothetical protein JW910_10930, partial [Anaerolineae bacterium]|nr:hypothetical protein [Anaerolineae bacterium]